MTNVGFSIRGSCRRIATRYAIDSDLPDPCVCQITPILRLPSGCVAAKRFLHREAHAKKLVILRALLVDLVVDDLERDEVPDVIEQSFHWK